MPKTKKRSISTIIEAAAKKLRVLEVSRKLVPIATIVFSKALIDNATSGYKYDTLAEHIIFEAARQSDIPITKEMFEHFTKKRLKMSLLRNVRDLLKKLGYEQKPINITKIAEEVLEHRNFPKEVSEKFIEMTEKLLEVGYPQRENPKVAVASVLCVAAESLGIKMAEYSAARLVFKERRSRRSNLVRIKEFKPIVEKILGRVYGWKEKPTT